MDCVLMEWAEWSSFIIASINDLEECAEKFWFNFFHSCTCTCAGDFRLEVVDAEGCLGSDALGGTSHIGWCCDLPLS